MTAIVQQGGAFNLSEERVKRLLTAKVTEFLHSHREDILRKADLLKVLNDMTWEFTHGTVAQQKQINTRFLEIVGSLENAALEIFGNLPKSLCFSSDATSTMHQRYQQFLTPKIDIHVDGWISLPYLAMEVKPYGSPMSIRLDYQCIPRVDADKSLTFQLNVALLTYCHEYLFAHDLYLQFKSQFDRKIQDILRRNEFTGEIEWSKSKDAMGNIMGQSFPDRHKLKPTNERKYFLWHREDDAFFLSYFVIDNAKSLSMTSGFTNRGIELTEKCR